jgi:hypothetical protein
MAQETLADIQAEHTARIERAKRYDFLRGEYNQNARLVERLGAQSANQRHINALLRILDEAKKLPETVVHANLGGVGREGVSILEEAMMGAIPDGVTGTMISAIASSALGRLRRLEDERAQQLDAAKQRRDAAKQLLKDEFSE